MTHLKKRRWSNTPCSVYTTDTALQGASLEAAVGQLTKGSEARSAAARAQSSTWAVQRGAVQVCKLLGESDGGGSSGSGNSNGCH